MRPKTIGDYSIVGDLGKGVYGVVYRAAPSKDKQEKSNLPPQVALKRAPVGDPATLAEARILTQLPKHLNIANLLDSFTATDGGLWLALDICDGGSLNEMLRTRGPCTPHTAACYIADMAAGISTMHQRGIVHCDIKADNVMLQFNMEKKRFILKIIDFGCARKLLADGTGSTKYVPQISFGPYLSSAPEVFREKMVTDRADVFSFGLLSLALFFPAVVTQGDFSLVAPFATALGFQGRALWEVPQPVIEALVKEHAPDRFQSLINKMLQLELRKRPFSEAILSKALTIRDKLAAELKEQQQDPKGEGSPKQAPKNAVFINPSGNQHNQTKKKIPRLVLPKPTLIVPAQVAVPVGQPVQVVVQKVS